MSRRLLIFAPNWLGDAVMSLPAVRAVRAAFPGAVLDVAARPPVAPMFLLASVVDRVVTLQGGAGDVTALQEHAYDTAILFPNSFKVAQLAWRSGIAERWGYRGNGRAWLLTKAVVPPARVHQVDHYRELVQACGCPADVDLPQLLTTGDVRAQGAALLRTTGWNGDAHLVALAPGAAFGTAKRWPAESFAGLADRLAGDGVQAVLLGSAGDRSAALELTSAMRTSLAPIDLVGRTDLSGLAGVLAHCRTLVTNDSGAMHFAAALGVPVTVMFGPTRERETSPRGPAGQACLTHQVWCRPCMLRECPLTHRCMTGISIDAVHTAARAFL